MSVHRKGSGWVVRYRDEAKRNRSRSFIRKADAARFDNEVTRRRQLGAVASLQAGRETLNAFVTQTSAPLSAATVSAKTRQHYASLYDHHLAPMLGEVALADLRPELIARWQAERLAAGGGRVAVAEALTLLGNILQRAVDADGHVIDELEDQPRVDAEEAIRQARVPSGVPSQFPRAPHDALDSSNEKAPNPAGSRAFVPVEPAGIEPATSCLQSRRSPS